MINVMKFGTFGENFAESVTCYSSLA